MAVDKAQESEKTGSEGRIAAFKKWYKESKELSSGWRRASEEDSAFYHGGKGQWEQRDIDKLETEGRPVLSINRIKTTIDLQKGIEIRNRTDIDAKPRTQDDNQTADAITSGFKYIQDQNNADHKISDVFFDGLKAGIGFVEICENEDPTKEEIAINRIDWKHMGWDPHARGVLLDDARYMFKEKWVDLEVAQEIWPKYKDDLTTMVDEQRTESQMHKTISGDQYQAGNNTPFVDTGRSRVLLVEMYFKKTEVGVFLKYRNGEVREIPREQLKANPLILADENVIRVLRRPVDKIWMTIFSGDLVLEEERPLKYLHNHYPIIPFICYMDEDGAPYGMIRNMKDPQREINKSRSQYSYILATRRVFYETGALTNPMKAKEEIARPDAWIELSHGALMHKRFQFSQDLQVAKEHFEIMREAKVELQEIAGAPQEQMGWETNARSGIAIEARQRQGATTNTEPFDNLRLMKHRMGELMLAMMRQYWDYQKVIRVTDSLEGSDKFVMFNMDDGTNDITQGRYDIVVSEHPETETTRNWMSQRLMDFATRMPPDIALPVLETSFEISDVPNKDKILRKLSLAQQKQDMLTQQRALIDSMGKDKSPPGTAETPGSPASQA